MNMSPDWADYLIVRGHETSHWSAVGKGEAGDDEIMAWAAEHDAVIISNDLDFGRMHALQGSSKPSVIQVRSADLRPEVIGHLITRSLTVAGKNLEEGAIVTIVPPRVRIAKLPVASV